MNKKKPKKPKPRPRGRPPSVTVKQLIKALKLSGGNASDAAEQLGVHSETVRNRIRNSIKLRKLVDEIRESTIDLAESKMVTLIKNGDGPMIRFYLYTIGKNRGYIRRSQEQLVGKNGEPVDPVGSSPDRDMTAFTEAELRKIIETVESSNVVTEAKKITSGE